MLLKHETLEMVFWKENISHWHGMDSFSSKEQKSSSTIQSKVLAWQMLLDKYFGQVQTLSNHIVVCILTPFINNYVMRFYYIILYYITSISYSSYIPINGPQNDLFYIPSLNFGETSWSLGRPWAHGLALRWTSAHAPSTCRVLEEIHGKWNGKMGCIKHISLKQKTCWTN